MWINTDINLGLPYKTFIINLRSPQAQRLVGIYAQCGGQYDHTCQSEIQVIANVLKQIIHEARPNLDQERMMVVGMGFRSFRNCFEVQVVHPALLASPNGTYIIYQLEPCHYCGKDIEDTVNYSIDQHNHKYCSTHCLESRQDQDYIPNPNVKILPDYES
jgi:hypothetical protein